MIKKYLLSLVALAAAISIAFAQTQATPPDEIEEDGVFEFCVSGGLGATSCSNNLGGGFTKIKGQMAYSVTCGALTYACCDFYSCKCKPYAQNH